jgi:hypothetical protein
MDLRAIPPCRFVCAACGKTSETRYGFAKDTDHDRGWDASCMLNAVLCKPTGHSPGRTFSGPHPGTAWHAVEASVEGVHYEAVKYAPEESGKLPAWDQSDGVVCPTCGGDFTLCEHGNELCAESGNGCATACIRCGAQVPDLGPLKTPYVCDDCRGLR